MKIKPLLKVTEGEIRPIEKIRTTVKLLDRFVEVVEKAPETKASFASPWPRQTTAMS